MAGQRLIIPDDYRIIDLDLETVITQLQQAPRWQTPLAQQSPLNLTFPMPDGSVRTFQVAEAPVMSSELAARYPGMRSFAGTSREDGSAYARFGYTHKGFHAMILSGQHSTVFIDVYSSGQTRFHMVYYKKDYSGIAGNDFICQVDEAAAEAVSPADTPAEGLMLGDCLLRNYRLALACTGEYAQFHGGTVPDVMAEYNVAMTRVNGVYERDVTVHMELIGRTDELIFLDGATDPYTNESGGTMLGENQTTIDNIIGFNEYDIGHVFSTGGGGVANLNAPCNSIKARGVTGLGSPVNDPFYIDYVAHEMGHQFGANHTQNNSCNRVGATAMEPGSASTIMGYAGICSPNVQNNSDDHFHAISIQEMTNNIEFGSGGSCPEVINTGNTGPDVAIASPIYNLPVSTPFFLTAIASDADGDELTYCWEQMDNEVADMPPLPTNDGGPAFRSNSPVLSPTRYFPNIQAVADNTMPTWEVLPSVARNMDFRCTVRDNAIGAGCTSSVDVSLSFSEEAGPFEVLSPNTAVTWIVGTLETVSWDVANTDAAPVSCSEVDIFLSVDGGLTYPIALATGVPNNGTAEITVPLELSDAARVQVVCSDNIFYDISNQNFAIELPPTPSFLLEGMPLSQSQCNDQDVIFEFSTTEIAGFDETLSFSVTGLPNGASATFSPNPAEVGEVVSLTVSELEDALPGTYTLEVEANAPSVTRTISLTLELDTGVPSTVTLVAPASGGQFVSTDTTLSWNAALLADEYLVEIATSPAFGNTVIESATVSNASYIPSQLEELTVYYWRVTPANLCGAAAASETFSFQTLKSNCLTYTNDDPGLVIPEDGVGMYTSTLVIPDTLVILDLNFYMDMSHTWVGDLSAFLQSPSGTQIPLFDQPGVPASTFGCGEDNLLIGFDDEALSTADDFENSCNSGASFAIEGIFQPADSLSFFTGEAAVGAWTLDLFDDFDQDGGMLNSWSLEICIEPDSIAAPAQLTNLPLEVFIGRSDTITTALLAHEKTGLSPSELTYRITKVPASGLLINTTSPDTLKVGDAFTQADIDMGQMIYQHDSSSVNTDLFEFDLIDPEGGWLPGQVFNILIVEPDSLSALAEISSDISCDGEADGSIEVFTAGGIPPYQYSLEGMPFQSSPVFDSLAEGTYTITIMDDAGIEFELSPITLAAPAPINGLSTAVDGTLTIDANGGTPPYSYSLDGENFMDDNVFTGLENGTYDIQVQDANGCTGIIAAEVNSILSAEVATTETSCSDTMDGSLEVSNIIGGTAPYIYQLNGGAAQGDSVFTGLAAGLYDLLITGTEGNTLLLEDIVVDAPAPLALTVETPSNGIVLMGQGGTPAYEYSIDGGATFSTDTAYLGLMEGDYDLIVQDANGCTFATTATVSFIGMATLEISEVSCVGNEDGSILVSEVDGGVAPYTYSLNGGAAQSDSLFTGLASGLYDLLITDAEDNMLLMEGVIVGTPEPLEISFEVNGSSLTLAGQGGTPPYEYSIDGGLSFSTDTLYTNLPNGNYDLIVQDANGCFFESVAIVNNLVDAQVAVTNISCTGSNDGLIAVTAVTGGEPPYSYSLSGGEPQSDSLFTGLSAGLYEILIVDASGNTLLVLGLMVTEPGPLGLDVQVMGNDLTLAGQGGTPPYQYSLDGGDTYTTVDQYEGLPNGTYNIAVQDDNGCTFFTSATVNPLTAAQTEVDGVSCAQGADGAITVMSILGGVPPFSFSLDGSAPQSEPIFSGLPAGVYELEITDAEGVSILLTDIVVEEPTPLEVSVGLVGNTLSIQGEGGTPPYQYSIDGGLTFTEDGVFPNLPNGFYDVVTADANGCTLTGTAFINIITDVQVDITHTTCSDSEDGIINVINVEGGEPPYTYSLDGGPVQSTGLFDGLPGGTYSIEVTDFSGNVFLLQDLNVMSPFPFIVEVAVAQDSITISASGGAEPYQYSIDGGATFISGSTFSGLENGEYDIVVMDNNGCMSEVQTVTVVISHTGELPLGWSVQLAPNPTRDVFWLEGTGLTGSEVRWQLLNTLGQLISSGSEGIAGGNCRLELSVAELPAGTYWVRLSTPNGQVGALPVVKQ
jgi:subtilisin-like proprotein convertase family protein